MISAWNETSRRRDLEEHLRTEVARACGATCLQFLSAQQQQQHVVETPVPAGGLGCRTLKNRVRMTGNLVLGVMILTAGLVCGLPTGLRNSTPSQVTADRVRCDAWRLYSPESWICFIHCLSFSFKPIFEFGGFFFSFYSRIMFFFFLQVILINLLV